MKIDGASANRATTGKRNSGNASAGQSWSEGKDGSAHGLDQFVRRDRIADGVSLKSIFTGGKVASADTGAHVRQKFAHGDDVADHRNVAQRNLIGGQQGSGHGRERGVFRAADGHRSANGCSAGNEKFVHEIKLPASWSRLLILSQRAAKIAASVPQEPFRGA